MLTDFPVVKRRADAFHPRCFIRVLRRGSTPSLASTFVAPCFSARGAKDSPNPQKSFGQRRGWMSVGQRCASWVGRRGNGVSEGLATPPRPRCCIVFVFLFSSITFCLLLVEFRDSSTPIWRSPPPMMSPLSRCWSRLAEALTCSFLSYMWQGGASTKPPSRVAKRDVINK